jgi:DnaK suppressor protein
MDIIDRAQQIDREQQAAIDEFLRRRNADSLEPPERAQVIDGIAYCQGCGEEMDPRRLQAKPDAVRCVECESRKERR